MPVDRARLHRFLVEHGRTDGGIALRCLGCRTIRWTVEHEHAPDCEWVALVAMTAPAPFDPVVRLMNSDGVGETP